MGIVSSQSFKNTIWTYAGFVIGAVNTLFLFTNFLEDEYYGLVAYILSTANILMPLMAFGVHNTLIKFYGNYKTKNNQNVFLTLMLILPLLLILPITFITYFFHDSISYLLSQENESVGDYIWYILFAAIAMAYFELFFAWSKAHMKTVFGNFLKEVFHRVGIALLLLLVFYKVLSVTEFITAVLFLYVLRTLIMLFYAFSIRLPKIRFQRLEEQSAILKYSSLIIIAGSIATIILDVDKFMIGQYLPIENVAYYSVAIYIATVIAVPQRAMHQILLPLTAKFLIDKNKVELENLYRRSSLTLLIISGLIFLLIVANIHSLYQIIPAEYSKGIYVVLLVSIAKLYDSLLGNNNAILFNSDYYRMVLVFGIVLTVSVVILNMILIPMLGINGSAIATLLAIGLYNTIKLLYVKKKFQIQPFNAKTIKVIGIIGLFFVVFYFWNFQMNIFLSIALKSLIIASIYIGVIYALKMSDDINDTIDSIFRRKPLQ